MTHILLYGASIVFGSCGAFGIARLGRFSGLTDHPTGRSSHSTPTPKGGGIGLLIAFCVAVVVLRTPAIFWFPIVIVSMAGLIADRFAISPAVRLVLQLAAAGIIVVGLRHAWPAYQCACLAVPVIIFIVGTANFYNFMDGINGIAACAGVVGFGLVSYYAFYIAGDPRPGALALCMAFACIGFLPLNFPRARVFMGDVGSILLGFLFAGFAVALSESVFDFLCLAACIFPFYADELTTMYVRLRDRDDLTRPHRKHLYQLMANEMGLPHWKVTVLYAMMQCIVGVSALALRAYGVALVVALACYFAAFSAASFVVRRRVAMVKGGMA